MRIKHVIQILYKNHGTLIALKTFFKIFLRTHNLVRVKNNKKHETGEKKFVAMARWVLE